MSTYKHTQVGYLLLVAYGLVILIFGYTLVATPLRSMALAGLVIMLLTLSIFASLTVVVDDRAVEIRFGLGLVRKRYRIGDIASCQIVRNPWYYGWGIRYTPRGWLYNVSGFSAVEIQLQNGKTRRIGTDDPQGLARALGEALNG